MVTLTGSLSDERPVMLLLTNTPCIKNWAAHFQNHHWSEWELDWDVTGCFGQRVASISGSFLHHVNPVIENKSSQSDPVSTKNSSCSSLPLQWLYSAHMVEAFFWTKPTIKPAECWKLMRSATRGLHLVPVLCRVVPYKAFT